MSNRPAFLTRTHIGVVTVKPGHAYRVDVGTLFNGVSMVEIAAVVETGNGWEAGNFATRFPAKTLRDFAHAFEKAADLTDAWHAKGRR